MKSAVFWRGVLRNSGVFAMRTGRLTEIAVGRSADRGRSEIAQTGGSGVVHAPPDRTRTHSSGQAQRAARFYLLQAAANFDAYASGES